MPQALHILDQVCVAAFAVLAMLAARSDWFRFTIPNRLSAAIAGLWVLYALLLVLQHQPLMSLVWSIGIALTVFLIGIGMFAANLLGGGDVKLLAAATLWVPPDIINLFFLIVTVSGAALGFAFLLQRFGNRPQEEATVAASTSTTTIADRLKRKTPYGVAIGIGCGVVALKLLNILPVGG